MNICVYGAASSGVDHYYIETVESLCEKLAKRGHDLVFGAGGFGMMGAAARGFHKGGGHVTGIVPEFFRNQDIEPLYDKCDELIYTVDMRERKQKMEDRADVFLIAPGGVGTFDEFFQALALKQLARHNKHIVLFNIKGYYDPFKLMFAQADEQNFVREGFMDLFGIFSESEEDELISYIESEPVDRDPLRAYVKVK